MNASKVYLVNAVRCQHGDGKNKTDQVHNRITVVAKESGNLDQQVQEDRPQHYVRVPGGLAGRAGHKQG